MRDESEQLYSADKKYEAGDKLKAALIQTLIQLKITYGTFSKLHREWKLSTGADPRSIASDRNNLIKAMFNKNTITFVMFESIMKNIIGWNLVGLTMTYRDRQNKPQVVSIDSFLW